MYFSLASHQVLIGVASIVSPCNWYKFNALNPCASWAPDLMSLMYLVQCELNRSRCTTNCHLQETIHLRWLSATRLLECACHNVTYGYRREAQWDAISSTIACLLSVHGTSLHPATKQTLSATLVIWMFACASLDSEPSVPDSMDVATQSMLSLIQQSQNIELWRFGAVAKSAFSLRNFKVFSLLPLLQVSVFVKAYASQDNQDHKQPYLVAGACSDEPGGKMLHGPVCFGARSGCIGPGLAQTQIVILKWRRKYERCSCHAWNVHA